ncbi:MAG: UDP-N-acetylmuramoyl-tripeptide--D-alanyl-D-alanine ligase [Nitrosomonas sp.]
MMTVQEAARMLNADWHGDDLAFGDVSTDSRQIKAGDLFVALSGDRFDGHDYIGDTIERGAVAALVAREIKKTKLPQHFGWIHVANTRLALGQLASQWRDRFSLPLVAVTGSNGKTTVKEMIASIFTKAASRQSNFTTDASVDQVLATIGNLNNDIGVPLTLLRLRQHHVYAVVEMGMNHAGEIAYLTQLAKPDIAVITNAGAAHIEGLGSIELVAHAKGEIFQGLDKSGVAIINADDKYAQLWYQLAGNRQIISFGMNAKAQIRADCHLLASSNKWILKFPKEESEIELQVLGQHNVMNALAAAAAALGAGVSEQVIIEGLSAFSGVKGRMQKKSGLHQATLIDDTYNANPASVSAALSVLAHLSGRKIFVLGDMGELGVGGADLHRKIGEEASRAGIEKLLALGELSVNAAEGFGKGAMHFSNIDELLEEAEKLLDHNVTMLVKGSRFMKMERVIQRFEVRH